MRLKYFFFPCQICNLTNGFSSSPLLPPPLSRPVPYPRVQPPFACLPVHVAALPGCDVARRLRRGSRVRPAARRPALSPGTEGRDMPAAAACPAPAPASPAPSAPAAAPSPEALGTWDGAPRPPGGAAARRGRGSWGRSAVRCCRLRGGTCARCGQRGVVRALVITISIISWGLEEAEAASCLRAFRFVYFYRFPCYLWRCGGRSLARGAMT